MKVEQARNEETAVGDVLEVLRDGKQRLGQVREELA